MSKKPSYNILRRLLKGGLEQIDKLEKQTSRSKKRPWYAIEYHVSPLLVTTITTVLMYGMLCWGTTFNAYQYSALGVFVVLLVVLFGFYLTREHPDLAQSDDATSLIAVLFFVAVLWIKIFIYGNQHWPWLSPYATPVGMAPLLATLLLHPRVAAMISFVVALLFGLLNNFSIDITLVAAIGGVSVISVARLARTTHHLVRAGLVMALVQLLLVLFLAIMRGWSHQVTAVAMASAFMSGILAAFFSIGALPYLESFFSRTSNLRLLELADVNHPLLRRMSIEAPGTYHHSMIVANLAADAAEAIGARGLLCRAGAYFHDIGKMVKSEYFIENQGTYGNPHDQVSPSLSKIVITSHVKEGIALGKEYHLDQQVLDFIPQHHGTSQIEYFYRKALKIEETEEEDEKEDVSEESYRYPGPKPQSRETGIVMLADSVEAASRTLEEPNHQRFKDLVYKIINKKLFDGQLSDTPLTLKDLHTIAERFTATLVSINHQRVPYPEAEESKAEDQEDRLKPPQ